MKSVQILSFFGLYFPVFSPKAVKYGPEKNPYLDTFHVVESSENVPLICVSVMVVQKMSLRLDIETVVT